MLEFLNKYARNIFASQNGEEGLLIEVLNRMDITTGHSCEFGASTGTFCSNTALLLQNGWYGLMIEGNYSLYEQCRDHWKPYPRVRAQCCYVDDKNINAFVDDTCDVLSVDCDGPDYYIFKGLKAKPQIVIIEIDSSIPPTEFAFNADGAAGYRPMVELGIEKGYFLLCHTGNIVLIDTRYRGLFPEIEGDGLSNSELYFNRSWIREAA